MMDVDAEVPAEVEEQLCGHRRRAQSAGCSEKRQLLLISRIVSLHE